MTERNLRFHPSLPLVEAKLQPPTQPHPTIERPRLLDQLTDSGGPRVVAVIAPPGYGKTTLLAQWRAREPRPVAWLTLDDLDNDPAILLTYVAAALDRIGPIGDAIRAGIGATRQRILATAVPHLASELHRWKRPAVLILDDAHRLVDRTSLDALTALIDYLPAEFRVAIAGRSEPDLRLARLRASGNLLEIGTASLAFDEREAGQLADSEGYALTAVEVAALTAHTEGWATGIHLATHAVARAGPDAGSLTTISGRSRHVADYLRSEFALHLEQDDIKLLTRTSILEVVTPLAADAISEVHDAGVRLGALARGSMFVGEVGAPGTAYRYHNMLRDFLGGELDRREPGVRPDLHRRAAVWYREAGDLDQAVGHATASGDEDLTARLVTAATLPMFYGGHPATVERWIEALGPSVFANYPPLAVIAGWIHFLAGRPEKADLMADLAERATFSGPPADGSASFESQRAMLRAVMGRHGPADVLANAQLAAAAEGHDSPWRTNALWLMGSARLLLGDVDAADAAFDEAIASGPATGATAMLAMAARAGTAIRRGDWATAELLVLRARDQLARSRFEEILPALLVYGVGARVAIHRGDPVRAREDLVRAQVIRPLASYAAPWFAVDALLEVARAYLAVADPAGARAALRQAEQIVGRRPALGVLIPEVLAMRRRLADIVATLAGSSTLTTTELRVLPFLPTYLSFQEIADRLAVSRNTVKTHVMSIYGKLQASSRGEAVERAVELGLLEPFPGLGIDRRASAG